MESNELTYTEARPAVIGEGLRAWVKGLHDRVFGEIAKDVGLRLHELNRSSRVDRDRWKGKKTTLPGYRPGKKAVPPHLKKLVSRL